VHRIIAKPFCENDVKQVMEMQIEVKADRKPNQAKAEDDREELKGMINAFQERTDANTRDIEKDIKSSQEEMRSIVWAFQEKMDACVANRKKIEKKRRHAMMK
jgi:hypothetical protein